MATDYPGWTMEGVYVGGTGGTPILRQDAEVVVLLKWPGSEDFRLALRFNYDPSPGLDWTKSPPSIFEDPIDAITFIRAFKAVHTEPGLVVVGPAAYSREAISNSGGSAQFPFTYTTLADFTASNGGQGKNPGFRGDTWRVTLNGAAMGWQLEGSQQ